MRRTLKSGLLAAAIVAAVGLTLLLGAQGLLAADGEEGVVTATVKINPLQVTLVVPGGPLAVGERFIVQAMVENRGETRIQRVAATLHLDTSSEPGLRVFGSDTRRLGQLKPFESRTAEWRLQALQVDSYVLMVTVSGIDVSDGAPLTAESDAEVISVE